ncbi:hypothetical protein L1987_89254 [Smallanthus sonchifolius]|nr:hypothetical protein L1987_89254 [Smallanthus sonchifolius]
MLSPALALVYGDIKLESPKEKPTRDKSKYQILANPLSEGSERPLACLSLMNGGSSAIDELKSKGKPKSNKLQLFKHSRKLFWKREEVRP